ncbi:MAG: MFS transporter, partial [Actinomycetota bacterium]
LGHAVTGKASKPISALYVANAVSLTGNVMTLTAIPWFVLQTTGSASKTGIIAFFNFLPVVIAGVFGGALVDRIGAKRMSVASDLVSGLTVASIPLLHTIDRLPFPALAGLVFLGALLDTPGMSARSALVPNLAERAGWPLERATGLIATVERGSRLAGAPLAGLLIATTGPINVLWVDAATFGFSAALMWLAVPGEARPVREGPSRYRFEIAEGFAFLRRDRPLAAMAKLVMATNFLDAWTGVLLVVYATRVYGSAVSLGLLIGVFGAGSMLGAIAFARSGVRFSRHALFAWCFIGVTVRYPAMAFFPPEAVLLAVVFVAGFASGPLNPLIDTVAYERIPVAMRGRVLSALRSAAWVAMPLGVLIAGPALDHLSLRVNVIAIGVAYVTVTASIRFSAAMREMNRAPTTPSEQELRSTATSPAVS